MNDGVSAVQSRIADLQRRFAPRTATTAPGRDTEASGLAGTGLAGTGLAGTGLAGTGTDFASLFAELQESVLAMNPGASTTGRALTGTAAIGDMRSTAARRQFGTDLLKRLGMPQTSENLRAMMAWQAAEGTSASFNPLATTRNAPGATNLNSVGVKNFRSYEQGLQTTIDTLRNGLYGDILAALRDGTSAARFAQAVADSPWGTGDGVSRVLDSGIS